MYYARTPHLIADKAENEFLGNSRTCLWVTLAFSSHGRRMFIKKIMSHRAEGLQKFGLRLLFKKPVFLCFHLQ